MKQITDINEIHSILLNIAKEFHRICVKHSIPYYMLGGTMLGAIRHNGFIPWDDDMDFGVPRKYIKHLVRILRKELPDYMSVITPLDDYGVVNEIIKVTDNRTEIDEYNKDHISNKMGVFIDVFPLDESNNDWSNWSRNNLILLALACSNFRYYPSASIRSRLVGFIVRVIPKSIYFKILSCFLPHGGGYISNYSGAYTYKETIPKAYFGKSQLYTFEDTKFHGVESPSDYLRCLYGDYMQLPPEDKRHFHLKGIFWK